MLYISSAPEAVERPPNFYVRAFRLRLRMSQRQLARLTGLDPSQIARIELGKLETELSTLRRLFDALFCDLVVVPRSRRSPSEVVGDMLMGPRQRLYRRKSLWAGTDPSAIIKPSSP